MYVRSSIYGSALPASWPGLFEQYNILEVVLEREPGSGSIHFSAYGIIYIHAPLRLATGINPVLHLPRGLILPRSAEEGPRLPWAANEVKDIYMYTRACTYTSHGVYT